MPVRQGELRVRGLKEFQRDLKKIDRELSREVDDELKDIAEIVAVDARQRFSAIDTRSGQGFKPRMRGFGRVTVAQTRRSKHLRPDFGGLQMVKGLIPALWSNAEKLERELEGMLDRLERKHGF